MFLPSAAVNNNPYTEFSLDASPSGDSVGTPEEQEKQRVLLRGTLDAILPRLKDFTALLAAPEGSTSKRRTSVSTSAGTLDPPLGMARLSEGLRKRFM